MSETGLQSEFITQIYEKVPRKCLYIPHAVEFVETVELLELLMHANY